MGGCSAQDMGILHKYGKVEKSISRDIIAPADITLHALHYAIQKLFGWQNSHLHHYEFPEQIFNELTGGSFARWCSLAGIYFRFPDEELDDLYWDDDYEPNISFKKNIKKSENALSQADFPKNPVISFSVLRATKSPEILRFQDFFLCIWARKVRRKIMRFSQEPFDPCFDP